MIRTLIIDDEINGRRTLQRLLEDYCSTIEIVGFGEDVASGVDAIRQLKPELVFLDIAMPDGEGFEVLEQLSEINFKTIFVTAHNEHAIRAFEYAAIHYLLKPINIRHLIEAVARVQDKQVLSPKNLTVFKEKKLNHNSNSILFDTLHHQEIFQISQISHFESNGKYAFLYLQNKQKVFIKKSLAELELLLQNHLFFRIHRSFLIQINAITKVKKVGKDCTIIMKNQYELGVATRKISSFLDCLKMFTTQNVD